MPEVSVPWGSDELKFTLPPQWQLQQIASPQLQPAPSDWAQRLAIALNQPTEGLPLQQQLSSCRNGRIVLIVEDITRHNPLAQILQIVLREIAHAGISREHIEIVYASCMHVPMTDEQVAVKLGDWAGGISWRTNPWTDPKKYTTVGTVGKLEVAIDSKVASAELRIIISSVSPHLQAGFGGGYKMLLPGCASLETIRSLHRLALGPKARQLVGTSPDTNEMRATIEAGGKLIDKNHGASFSVQYLLDDNDLPTNIAAGEPSTVQQMLTKQCSVACGVITSTPADIVISNAHPRDYDLWQSFKAIANTCWSARPNGVIICTTMCQSGTEGMTIPPWPISPVWTRRLVRFFGAETLSSTLSRFIPSLAGDAAFFVRMGLQTLHRCHLFIVSPAVAAMGKPFPGLTVFATTEEAVAAAQDILGSGRQRVIVFPAGGTTFPVLAGTAAPKVR